jgi:UDP-N-acetylmuramyl tripeptide synthase
MALRAKYAGVPGDRIEIVPGRAEALDHALQLAGAGGTAYVLPTYTAMLELQRVAAERGLVRPYWETAPR